MTLDHRFAPMGGVRSTLTLAVAPIQYLVDLPVTVGRWFSESLATRRSLMDENARLRTEHLLLEAQVQKLEALQVENRRLRELLHAGGKVPSERVLVAELLAVDADPFSHQFIINKGSRNGVYPGQPLLDAHGVVGQVVEVGPVTSRALMITDSSHALPVQVNRNGVRALALGTGVIDRLELAHVPDTADIREGDLLVTSGLGGRFPRGYPVGRVEQVTHDPGQPYALVVARPKAQLDRIREVLLVWTMDEPVALPGTTAEPAAGEPAKGEGGS